jgi:hypothetical protein
VGGKHTFPKKKENTAKVKAMDVCLTFFTTTFALEKYLSA